MTQPVPARFVQQPGDELWQVSLQMIRQRASLLKQSSKFVNPKTKRLYAGVGSDEYTEVLSQLFVHDYILGF